MNIITRTSDNTRRYFEHELLRSKHLENNIKMNIL